jgi:hypothetical protein
LTTVVAVTIRCLRVASRLGFGAQLLWTIGCGEPQPATALPEAPSDSHVSNGNGGGGGLLGAAAEAPALVATALSASGGETRVWLAWDVRIEGERMQWRPCDDAQHCRAVLYTASARDLVGMHTVSVARLSVDGAAATQIEIKQLRFRPDSDAESMLETAAKIH